MAFVKTFVLLFFSNVFMTYAWYGHLKDLKGKPLLLVVAVSWGIALFEYLLQVPANRIGAQVMTLPQLKIVQEVFALFVFGLFYRFYWNGALTWHFAVASLLMIAAVAIIFQSVQIQ